MSEFVLAFGEKNSRTEIYHRNGVNWPDAPIPPRWHRCQVQTYGYVDWFNLVCRCACGAISADGRRWKERNSRVTKAAS